MKLKKIILENIRSYEYQEISFSDGSVLLSGDIGSGKTSVLLGIEFALFGLQPGQRGAALLRNQEQDGKVVMEIEIDGQSIIIERTLKRGKTVSQSSCSISIDNEKKDLSVTELKNKILELLNYPKEFAKKQNLLYRFTVYTPQEEMKQIIIQDPESRINTLRHVFGIDKYKKILENVSILTAKLREEMRIKQAITANIEQDKMSIDLKEKELEIKNKNLVLSGDEFVLKQSQRKKIQSEKDEVSKKREERLKFQQEIEKARIMMATKKDYILNNSRLIKQLDMQIKEFLVFEYDESKISEFENEIGPIKKTKQELNEKNLVITSQIQSLKLKNQENNIIKEKLSRIEVCPTCMQDVNKTYKFNVLNKLDSNLVDNLRKIDILSLEKKSIDAKIEEADLKISLKTKKVQELNILKVKYEGITEKKKRLGELEKENLSLEKDVELLNKHLENMKISIFELTKFDNLFNKLQQEYESAVEQERFAEIKSAELKKEIDFFSFQIKELKEKLKKSEQIRSELNYLTHLEDWLSKNFTQLISHVERNVMTNLKIEFSKLFSEWFLMLVSDPFNVRLSDDFTPVIEQQDYEIDYEYLSGGERTAVALAYRLSLNQVINSLISKIKTRDIVILDEPTDGFSDQQLDKMRDVFQQLNVKQLIIVSHEQKIEGFVENVLRFKKENGISKMSYQI